jgi:hypothetical protein
MTQPVIPKFSTTITPKFATATEFIVNLIKQRSRSLLTATSSSFTFAPVNTTQITTPTDVVAQIAAPTINIINNSTKVNDSDLLLMVEAVITQLNQHVAPAWLTAPWNIVLNQPETIGYPIVIFDDSDSAGALGYHTESPSGKVWGRVFVNPILNNGGTILLGSLSVSAVLSHEVIEAYCNPNVNLWADTFTGTMIAREAADPVEDDFYDITTKSGAKVSVSNFVTPMWFDPQSADGSKFDHMTKLTKPFTMSSGGYVVTMNKKTGIVKNVFGSIDAETQHALRQAKHPAARSSRILVTAKK